MPRAQNCEFGFVRGPGWHLPMIKEATALSDLGRWASMNILMKRLQNACRHRLLSLDRSLHGEYRGARPAAPETVRHCERVESGLANRSRERRPRSDPRPISRICDRPFRGVRVADGEIWVPRVIHAPHAA